MEEGVLFHGLCDMGISQIEEIEQERSDLENVHDLASHRDKLRSQEM